jgi:GNAT superfamily N-acetyltransferase
MEKFPTAIFRLKLLMQFVFNWDYKKHSMNTYYQTEKNGFIISTDPNLLQIDTIHKYLSEESYWAQNIPFEILKKAIENSLCFGIYTDGKQIGFARLITDKTTFAYLCDVYILKDWRGKNLSKWMLNEIHVHPDLQTLRRWLLATKEAHGLYAQFGWKTLDEEAARRMMQVHHPNVYQDMIHTKNTLS